MRFAIDVRSQSAQHINLAQPLPKPQSHMQDYIEVFSSAWNVWESKSIDPNDHSDITSYSGLRRM